MTVLHVAEATSLTRLTGNRNFEGRVHPLTRANYLASPPLVVAYALAVRMATNAMLFDSDVSFQGTVAIDFETEPLGTGSDGQPVFLRDIWPSADDIQTGP